MSRTPPTFEPPRWLRNRHVQTLWPVLFRRLPPAAVRRERLETADGDYVDLDWLGPDGAPIVILLHGLTGSSRSIYMRAIQRTLAEAGLLTVALNFRGCGGEPNRLARCYHSGDTEDVQHLYEHLRHRHPRTPMAAVGFSLGGNVLLKWLGEGRRPDRLCAAAAVSVPFLLNRCADRMDQGFSRVYRNSLLDDLKRYVAEKHAHLQRIGAQGEADKLRDLGDLSAVDSFWRFDGRVIAPLYGFRDAMDYYEQSSSRRFIPRIETPTLILHAQDDPFVPPDAIPGQAELPACVELQATGHGGHLGFVGGRGPSRYWWEERVRGFLLERLGEAAIRRPAR